MKKRKYNRILSLLLVMAIFLTGIPGVAKAANPKSEAPKFKEETDINKASVSEVAIDATTLQTIYEEKIVSGDSYIYSGRINVDNKIYDGSVRFLVAEHDNNGTKEKLNVCFRPGKSGQSVHNQYVLFSNSGTSTETGIIAGGITEVEIGMQFTYTVVYNAGVLSFYVDDCLVIDNYSLTEKIGTVTPKIGIMAYQCAGEVTDIRLWGENIQVNNVKPTFNANTDTNASVLSEFPLVAADYTELYFEGLSYKENYTFSGTVSAGVGETGFLLGTAVYNGKEASIRVCFDKNTGKAKLVLRTATEDKVLREVEVGEVKGESYLYTVQYDTGVVSFWLNDTCIISQKDLRKVDGIEALRPKAGVSAKEYSGEISDIKIWGEVGRKDEIFFQKYTEIESYRIDNAFTAPASAGFVFAGWYKDAEDTTCLSQTDVEGAAYAKFVPEKVLSVKAQMVKGTSMTTSTTDIRFITTVDSLKYSSVGYDFLINGKTTNTTSSKVYERISGKNGLGAIDYKPSVFHSNSQFFFAHNITGIPKNHYTTDIQVTPYWQTKDGTKVSGVARTVQIQDGCLITTAYGDFGDLFHDQANEYISNIEPAKDEAITIRLRAERGNITKAVLQYATESMSSGRTYKDIEMTYDGRDNTGYYEYFVGTIPAQTEMVYYRFKCSNSKLFSGTTYLYRTGQNTSSKISYPISQIAGEGHLWILNPGYKTPDWSKGALWYSLVPDSFYNGDTSNDIPTSDANLVSSWNNNRTGLSERYGGDLSGISEQIEHIKSLGADAVYMNPISKSSQALAYGQIDFMQIDSTFGNGADLLAMTDLMHKNNLKIVLDSVMTFLPYNSIYLRDDAYSDMWDSSSLNTKWGGYNINNSSESARKLFFTEPTSYLRYFPNVYGIDGWRFDCGGDIAGTKTDGTKVSSAEIMKEVRHYIKEVDNHPDTILISEYSSDNDVMGDSWDGRWNLNYLWDMRSYATGELCEKADTDYTVDETMLAKRLDLYIKKFPRSVALSTYNYVNSHDHDRMKIEDEWMEKAMILVQMNYLGSPCIYYGDEVGVGIQDNADSASSDDFSAMDWDKTNWDYEKYDFYRALGELRNKYSAVKTGAIRDILVDASKNLYAFGRWDDKGTVITVASQNAGTVSAELNVRQISVCDGTVFTDWMTGKQYQVDANGILHVDVEAGGCVLVSGTETSQYCQAVEKEVSSKTSEIYGAGSIQAVVKGNGKATLSMSQNAESDAASYNVTVNGNTLEVTARKTSDAELKTVCSVTYDKDRAIRIERTADNTFYVSLAEISYSGKTVGTWKRIENSKTVLTADRDMLATIKTVSGITEFRHVKVENSSEILCDTFENGDGSAFLKASDGKTLSVSGGKLILDGTSDMTAAVANGREDDWTFKTTMASSVAEEGAYAGVICEGGKDMFVTAGRTVLDGKPVIFLGRTTDGRISVDEYVKDTDSNAAVTIQLQRIGTIYTAVFSYDGVTWEPVGDGVFANYSLEEPGVFAKGTEAKFEYVCFGDSVNDHVSECTPYSEEAIDMDYSSYVAAKVGENLTELTGTWVHGEEGYYQTDASAEGKLVSANKVYEDVRVNVTLKPEFGVGYAAIGFGKPSHDAADTEGFMLKYTNDGKLILSKGSTELAEADVSSYVKKDGLKVVMDVVEDDISVYVGEDAACVIAATNTGYKDGFVTFMTHGITSGFLNYRISSLSGGWKVLAGDVTGGANSLKLAATGKSAVARNGIGVTDFVATASIRVGTQKDTAGDAAEGGLLFCAPEGDTSFKKGIAVSLVSGGTLRLTVDGVVKSEYALGTDVSKCTLMVVKKDNQIQVYVQGNSSAVLTYDDTCSRGGTVQFYCMNTVAVFEELGLEGVTGKDIATADLYTKWQKGKLPVVNKKLNVDFASEYGWKSLTKHYTDQGKWTIADGVLSCTDATGSNSMISVYDSRYENFTLEFDYKVNEKLNGDASFGVVSFRKPTTDEVFDANANSTNTFYSLQLNGGYASMYYGATKITSPNTYVKYGEFAENGWIRMKIECEGAQIKVSIVRISNGETKLLYTITDPNYDTTSSKEGFISFSSNKILYSIDNLKVTPIQRGISDGGIGTGGTTGWGDF